MKTLRTKISEILIKWGMPTRQGAISEIIQATEESRSNLGRDLDLNILRSDIQRAIGHMQGCGHPDTYLEDKYPLLATSMSRTKSHEIASRSVNNHMKKEQPVNRVSEEKPSTGTDWEDDMSTCRYSHSAHIYCNSRCGCVCYEKSSWEEFDRFLERANLDNIHPGQYGMLKNFIKQNFISRKDLKEKIEAQQVKLRNHVALCINSSKGYHPEVGCHVEWMLEKKGGIS